jgi:uncharacterized protein (TIGR02265 family)
MNFASLPPERDRLRERIKLLSGEETIRGTPFQAMHDLVARLGGSEDVDACRAAAQVAESSFNIMKKYSLRSFLLFEQAAAERLAIKLGGFEQAVFRLGAAAVDVFFDSVAGRTMKLLAGREPHRLLGSVSNGYSVLVNFGSRDYLRQSDRSGIFSFRGELLGAVHTAGIFDQALRTVYEVTPQIDVVDAELVDFKFKLSW